MPTARRVFFVTLALGSLAITWGSLAYFREGTLHPFVLDKEPLPLPTMWMAALYVHILTAAFSLPACLLLASRRVLGRVPRLHRWLGRLTGVVILAGLVPSGLVLCTTAEAGLMSSLGFALSGLIVALAMVQAVRAARARNYVAHARATTHVLAQLSVAVTSRALLFAFARLPLNEELAYLVALWIPVVASALYVERRALVRLPAIFRRNDETRRVSRVVRKSDLNVGAR